MGRGRRVQAELAFFDQVTAVSGKLYQVNPAPLASPSVAPPL